MNRLRSVGKRIMERFTESLWQIRPGFSPDHLSLFHTAFLLWHANPQTPQLSLTLTALAHKKQDTLDCNWIKLRSSSRRLLIQSNTECVNTEEITIHKTKKEEMQPVQFGCTSVTYYRKANRDIAEVTAPVLLLTQGFCRHNPSIQGKAREAKGASKNLIWTWCCNIR